MAEKFEITAEMKSKVGWESPAWTYEVTPASVRAFARGVGYTDLVYYDRNAARKAGYRDLPAPPTYLGTPVFIPGQSDDTFGHPLDSDPPLEHGLDGLLDGGTEIEYFDMICAGDTLTAVKRLTGLKTKDSKALGTMLLLSTETTYTNQDGKAVAILRTQLIYY